MDQLPRLGKRELICYCLLVIMWFLLERFPLPLGAWGGLRYFIVALPEPSILLFWTIPLKAVHRVISSIKFKYLFELLAIMSYRLCL